MIIGSDVFKSDNSNAVQTRFSFIACIYVCQGDTSNCSAFNCIVNMVSWSSCTNLIKKSKHVNVSYNCDEREIQN